MPIRIQSFKEHHLQEAADLATRRYQLLLNQVPYLPEAYTDPDHVGSLIADMISASPGVLALQDGRLVGFLCAWSLKDFQGMPAAFSPELANGASLFPDLPDEFIRRIYEEMYTYISSQWVAEGVHTHLISILANDTIALQTWHWLGFGMAAADGLRPLDALPVAAPEKIALLSDQGNIIIRRAGLDDAGAILRLDTALDQYLAGAPTFLTHEAGHSSEDVRGWLENPENAFWIARKMDAGREEPVAFLWMAPASREACTIIIDKGTTSILGAYTVESARSQGIATALLDEGLSWARQKGYSRCAVDFEPMNPLARRFWLRYFQPVSLTLSRKIQ